MPDSPQSFCSFSRFFVIVTDCVKTNVLSHGVLADPFFSRKQIYLLRYNDEIVIFFWNSSLLFLRERERTPQSFVLFPTYSCLLVVVICHQSCILLERNVANCTICDLVPDSPQSFYMFHNWYESVALGNNKKLHFCFITELYQMFPQARFLCMHVFLWISISTSYCKSKQCRSFEVCRLEVQHFSFLLSLLSMACFLPCTWRLSSQHLLLQYLMKMAQATLQAKEAESSITEEMFHDLKNQRSLWVCLCVFTSFCNMCQGWGNQYEKISLESFSIKYNKNAWFLTDAVLFWSSTNVGVDECLKRSGHMHS